MTTPQETFARVVGVYTARLQADLGIKGFHADGIFGNIGHECDGFTKLQEVDPVNGGDGGYGWLQWTGPRRRAYLQFCTDKAIDPKAAESNYLFLVHETLTDQRASLDALRKQPTRDDAVREWMNENERPDARYAHLDERIVWAKRAQVARLTAENAALAATSAKQEKTMNDTTNQLAAGASAVSEQGASTALHDALSDLQNRLLDLAASQLAKHGGTFGPAIAASLSLVRGFNLPNRAEAALRKVDIESLVLKGVSMLIAKV